jgi:Holliday junction resolvase
MKGKEGKIQKAITDKLTSKGYFVINLIKTNRNGIPDLLALKDGEKPLFIEVKTETGRTSELQKYRIEELKSKGFKAVVLNNTIDLQTHL